jgi:glycosyltransferase involved in cell wall biosynthesis
MFVHMRSLEFMKQGQNIEVYVPSNNTSNYVYENVNVKMMPSKGIVEQFKKGDVLYLHLLNIYPFSKTNGWEIYKHLMKNKLPFAMYVHGSEVQRFGSRMFDFSFKGSTFLKWFKKDVLVIPKMKRFIKEVKLRDNVLFIYPSKWMKVEMEENLKQEITKYEIIPNGIDTHLFDFQNRYENRYKMLTLRPLSSNKYAVDIAIEIVSHLPVEFSLEIYGSGGMQAKFQKQIDDLNLSTRVKIKNQFIDRSQMNTFFSSYGVFLAPTRMDAQGVSMCEALASGLLTVSNNNTAIPEFITDYKEGILGNSSKEIAKKIVEVIENRELFEKITAAGRSSMEAIDISKTASQEIRKLEQICYIDA